MTAVEDIETEIAPLALRHGLSIYDIERVSFGRPLLRVFVERAPCGESEGLPLPASGGVTVGEIEAFAKILIPFLNLKDLFPREGNVEVSSPGLNRKLKRPGHFTSAVGNPIDVTTKTETGKRTIRARLLSVSGDGITLDSPELSFVPFPNILRAELQPDIRI